MSGKRPSLFRISFLASVLFIAPRYASADNQYSFGFQNLKPQDYLFAPSPDAGRDLFDNLRPIEGSVNLSVGSDCGKISIDSTLRSTFGNVLNGNYFKNLVTDILGAVPMMTACYMSPTWCSVLKHTQIAANFLTQTRLSQCQIIDKYIDSRTEDYYRERQSCTQRAIQQNGGDMEAAMASCQNNVFEAKAGKWAGESRDNPNQPNELISNSAEWAGFSGEDGKKVTQLIKSMVGDTILSQGTVRVEYGPRAHAYSPRAHLTSLENGMNEEFCGKLVPSVTEFFEQNRYLSDLEIQKRIQALKSKTSLHSIEDSQELEFLTPELIRNLAYLPINRRNRICNKLAQALAMTRFTRDMNQALDVLTVAAHNPNLPPNRRQEMDNKRTELKDQIDVTLKLKQEQNKPMGEVMQYIAQEGLVAEDSAVNHTLTQEGTFRSKESHSRRMNDCSDGVFCNDPSQRSN